MQLFTLNLHFNPPLAVLPRVLRWKIFCEHSFSLCFNRIGTMTFFYIASSMFRCLSLRWLHWLANCHMVMRIADIIYWAIPLIQKFLRNQNVQRKKQFVFNFQSIHSDKTTHRYTRIDQISYLRFIEPCKQTDEFIYFNDMHIAHRIHKAEKRAQNWIQQMAVKRRWSKRMSNWMSNVNEIRAIK